MNIYEKLNAARVQFQSGNPKMSGKNTFAGYQYFELSDILPVINQIGMEMKFSCLVSFTPELATLSVIDTEKPEDKIVFASPMSSAALKGCHEVQNLGAVETYIKRYLYQNAFEIVESDALNGTQGKDDKAAGKTPAQPSELTTVKTDLLDWLNATPCVFNDEWTKYANGCISNNDIKGMKTCIETAKKIAKGAK